MDSSPVQELLAQQWSLDRQFFQLRLGLVLRSCWHRSTRPQAVT